ncbi:chitin elicitor receptor kinase 1 [Selaginella moellendorffii]|uniref:chitin elicitor receptor kinase 1 n=1 Tax=Selaginella moellendorffii TaxID=88036 RepID=UPI000D1CECC2|nr:chitin elicitor receptor kinase 1 [Selaginella moellendorffii]|eukprot:XP_024523185.1 chitin elicitor receptor kinase 1 [Selaginella moellendorffii]
MKCGRRTRQERMGSSSRRSRRRRDPVALVCSIFFSWVFAASSSCVPGAGCPRALLVFNISAVDPSSLQVIYDRFSTSSQLVSQYNQLGSGNNSAQIFIPFDCQCVRKVLQHNFPYEIAPDDTTLFIIAQEKFQGLTRDDWIAEATPLKDKNTIFAGLNVKVPVNCSCGNPDVDRSYGLFATYVVQPGDTLSTISARFKVPDQQLLQRFNPHIDFQRLIAQSIVFVPAKDSNGLYPPYSSDDDGHSGVRRSTIVGASVGSILAVLLAAAAGMAFFLWKRKHLQQDEKNDRLPSPAASSTVSALRKASGTPTPSGVLRSNISSTTSVRSAISDIALEKSIEFSLHELVAATNNFNETNKIGQGGYGSVYYGYFRDQKLAVKRMNMQATKEFLSELKILSRVHHSNLVQLIGYCTVESLFLVYEFVDNGTLAQHLHSTTRPPLSWSSRIQIAMDAARGLEYIHEHAKPTYIHRDIKSTNILIDKNFHAKVADFGLSKLTETGMTSISLTQPTRLVGTFGYMSPEYARYGDVSPFLDVYSFGVVLFEIISAQEAIVRTQSGILSNKDEQKGLATLFEDVLQDDTNGKERLRDLMDPRLGDNYPLEAAWSLAKLAGACTKENPELRPNMRTVVVALMTLMHNTASNS